MCLPTTTTEGRARPIWTTPNRIRFGVLLNREFIALRAGELMRSVTSIHEQKQCPPQSGQTLANKASSGVTLETIRSTGAAGARDVMCTT